MMWHEARKQEKKIRCMLVDYQRRAQRRKDYYDKIKADPTQFLQLHGRPCKIHLDPAVCIAANSSVTMMPWQGNSAVMIDRFDVRAHLDYIPDVNPQNKEPENLSYEERQINYERYRILVQNDFFNIAEDKFLHQIHVEEKFGPVLKSTEEPSSSKKRACAAIGYIYDGDDNGASTSGNSHSKVEDNSKTVSATPAASVEDDEENDSESDIDLDLTVDVSKIETQQAHELNSCAHAYGMLTNDFFSFLNNDLEEAENMRIAKEQEEEKAMFSGRKSRKERRAFRERTLVGRKLSPPSYAWRKSPSYEDYKALVSSNRSRSKSSSPANSGKITYITSFGGDEPTAPVSHASKFTASFVPVTQKESSGKRTRSRSRSREKEKRSRRSRSASADYRRKSRSRRVSSSNSRSRSRSRARVDSSRFQSRFDKKIKRRSSSGSSSRSSPRTEIPSVELPKTSAENVSAIESTTTNNAEPVTIPRYYGRRKNDSSSELTLSSDDDSSKQSESSKSKTSQPPGPVRLITSIKGNSSDNKLTPQERLRRKRQVMLNKQFKADKRAEREKVMKMVQERIDRAEEMKEISIKLRRRQRMLRHNDGSPRRHSSRSRSSSSDDRSTSRSPGVKRNYRRVDKHRSSSTSSSDGSPKTDRRRTYKKHDGSDSRSRSKSRSRSRNHSSSRSRSRNRSRSLNRSRSPRRSRYSEERDLRCGDRSKASREHDKTARGRRYGDYNEERDSTRGLVDSRMDTADVRDDRDDYRTRKERSPKYNHRNEVGSSEKKDRTYDSDRYRSTNRSRFSRRSSSRDRHFSRYDH